MRRSWAIGVAVALAVLTASCGTATDDPVASTDSTSVSADADDAAEPAFDSDVVQTAIALAEQLVTALGSDEAAVDALLLAFEAGYESDQVITAVSEGTLQADGAIDGVSPGGAPLGRVQPISLDLEHDTETTTLLYDTSERGSAVILSQEPAKPPLLVDLLRTYAIDKGTQAGVFPVGEAGTTLIIAMAHDGYSSEEILDALIFGEFEVERYGKCWRVIVASPPIRTQVPCRGESTESPPSESAEVGEIEENPSASDADSAVYVGQVPQGVLANAESRIELIVSADGTIGGTLTLREELECGVVNDCDLSCPTVVDYYADLSTLFFSGEPFEGTVEGNLVLEVTTTPDGCAEQTTATNELQLAGMVSPERAELSEPFAMRLEREPPA